MSSGAVMLLHIKRDACVHIHQIFHSSWLTSISAQIISSDCAWMLLCMSRIAKNWGCQIFDLRDICLNYEALSSGMGSRSFSLFLQYYLKFSHTESKQLSERFLVKTRDIYYMWTWQSSKKHHPVIISDPSEVIGPLACLSNSLFLQCTVVTRLCDL